MLHCTGVEAGSRSVALTPVSYTHLKRLNVLCKEAIEQSVRDNYRDNRLDADAVWRDVTAQFGTCLLYTSRCV